MAAFPVRYPRDGRPVWTTLLLLLVGATCAACGSRAAQPSAPPPLPVSVIAVEPRPVIVYDEYTGQTAAPRTIEIRSQVTGLLERQAFRDGQRVNQGALLYVIDERPFASALTQARANLEQARANLANAQQTADRYKQLVAAKFISPQAYDTAADQARAAAAAVDAQQALLREAQIDVDYTRIRAPTDGYVSQTLVNPGGLVTKQDTLLTTLYSSDPMYVYFGISEDKLRDLRQRLEPTAGEGAGAAPAFQILLADGSEYRYAGRLNFVDAAVDAKTGTITMRVTVANPDRELRPGLFVRVRVPALQRQAITVPQKAVIELQGLKTVYVVDPHDVPQQRSIEASQRIGSDWVVENGLQPGERVIVEGFEKMQMRPGLPIKPVMVAANGADRSTPPGTTAARAASEATTSTSDRLR